MAPEASTIYNRLDIFDHLDRENVLYIKLLLLSTLWQSSRSHKIPLLGTNKDNLYHGFINRKPVKYHGEFFFIFNRPIPQDSTEQDNGLDFAIIKVNKTCPKGIVKYEHMYMFFELIRTSDKNNHNFLVFVNHLYPSYNLIFFTWGCVPNVSNQMAAPLLPKNDAKPRHSQSMLIPGRVSTSGCARGGAFVLATKNHEEKKVSTIVTIYQTIKTRKHHTYWAAPRSRERVIFGMWNYHVILSTLFKGELLLFPALRLHLWGGQCLRLADCSYFSFLSKIPEVLSNGPDEQAPSGPPQHHALLISTSFQINKLKEVFIDQLTGIVISSEDRAVSGPGSISLKKYPGLLLHGFLFLATKEHEGHEGEEQGAGSREQKKNKRRCLQRVGVDSNKWVSRGGSRKRSRRISNGKGQMVKTLRKNILTSTVKKVRLFLHQRRFKTNYLANKRFSLAVSVNRLYQNTPETKYTSFLHGASFIFVDVIVPVCMTWLPPCKHNSQTFITLPLPILMIHLSLESSPLPLTCEQGAKSVDCRQLALRFALLSLPLRRTKSND